MAEIANLDFEVGDTSEFTSTLVEAGNTLEATTAAVKDGTYGLRAIGGGTNDDARGRVDLGAGGTLAEVWCRFWFRLAGNVGVGNDIGVACFSPDADSETGGFWGIRSHASDFTNRMRVWNGAGWETDPVLGAFDFTANTWYLIRMRVKIATSTTGELDLWTSTDGTTFTQRYGQTDLNLGTTNIRYLRFGLDHNAVVNTYWYDSIIADNAAYPTEGAADPEGSLVGGKLLRGGLLKHGVLVRS